MIEHIDNAPRGSEVSWLKRMTAAVAMGGVATFGLAACGDNEAPTPTPSASAGATPGETPSESASESPSSDPTEVDPTSTIGVPNESFEGLNVSAPDSVIEQAMQPVSTDLSPEDAFRELLLRVNVWNNGARVDEFGGGETEASMKQRDKLTNVIYVNGQNLEAEKQNREIIGLEYNLIKQLGIDQTGTYQETYSFGSIESQGDSYTAEVVQVTYCNFTQIDTTFGPDQFPAFFDNGSPTDTAVYSGPVTIVNDGESWKIKHIQLKPQA